jgi:hypothetical protein
VCAAGHEWLSASAHSQVRLSLPLLYFTLLLYFYTTTLDCVSILLYSTVLLYFYTSARLLPRHAGPPLLARALRCGSLCHLSMLLRVIAGHSSPDEAQVSKFTAILLYYYTTLCKYNYILLYFNLIYYSNICFCGSSRAIPRPTRRRRAYYYTTRLRDYSNTILYCTTLLQYYTTLPRPACSIPWLRPRTTLLLYYSALYPDPLIQACLLESVALAKDAVRLDHTTDSFTILL